MTRDETLKAAGDAGIVAIHAFGALNWNDEMNALERFAELVAKHEREACAKLAQETVCDVHTPTGIKIYGTKAAQAIRARGES